MKKKPLEIFKTDVSTELIIPYADEGIKAGFPSPAQDYLSNAIDLNKELIKNPSATFFGKISGDSMIDAGLNEGDIIVIDKSIRPRDGQMAVCFIDGEFTIKFIEIHRDYIMLNPANTKYKPIKITPDNNFIIWGIVTYSIRNRML